jgi:hypothetical protein
VSVIPSLETLSLGLLPSAAPVQTGGEPMVDATPLALAGGDKFFCALIFELMPVDALAKKIGVIELDDIPHTNLGVISIYRSLNNREIFIIQSTVDILWSSVIHHIIPPDLLIVGFQFILSRDSIRSKITILFEIHGTMLHG